MRCVHTTVWMLALGLPCTRYAPAQPFGIEQRVPNLELRLNSLPGGDQHPVPEKLSDLPALLLAARGRGTEVAGVIPYAPSAKLWSDGAVKERFIALPDYAHAAPGHAQVSYRPAGGWDFPDDSVIVKNFLLPLDRRDLTGSLRRIETRILYKHKGAWYGFTYEWNEEETDALLVPAEKKPRDFTVVSATGEPSTQTWTYPGRSDCLQCHTAQANRVLGLNTPQMNQQYVYQASGVADNQLRTLDHIGFFASPLPATPDLLPRMPDSADLTSSIDARARAYLAANCGNCHRPGVPIDAEANLTWEVSRQDMNAIDTLPNRGPAGLPANARVIYAGRPELSVLLSRMETLNAVFRMPRVASHVVDTEAVELIRQWIVSLEIPVPAQLVGEAGAGQVTLEWMGVIAGEVRLDGYNVYRSRTAGKTGERVNALPLPGTSFVDRGLEPGTYHYTVKTAGEGRESEASRQLQIAVTRPTARFLRGNCNGDDKLDLSDAIFSLGFLFLGGANSTCEESCDANLDGRRDLSDPITVLRYLFSGGQPPGLFPACEPALGSCDPGACTDRGE